jgi:hypothetical protein
MQQFSYFSFFFFFFFHLDSCEHYMTLQCCTSGKPVRAVCAIGAWGIDGVWDIERDLWCCSRQSTGSSHTWQTQHRGDSLNLIPHPPQHNACALVHVCGPVHELGLRPCACLWSCACAIIIPPLKLSNKTHMFIYFSTFFLQNTDTPRPVCSTDPKL